jgi:hypothetical protein
MVKNRRIVVMFLILLVIGLALAAVSYLFLLPVCSHARSNSSDSIEQWFRDLASRPALTTTMNQSPCPGAPFSLPSDGLIGLLWGDPLGPYTLLNPHTGIDIFGDGEPGTVPVYAAYEGYLTRRQDWLASVIIRHDDPLQPGRTIWSYYTHMASEDGSQSFVDPGFPPGTADAPVKQGTLLGHQGEYAGLGRAPIGLHVHVSLVLGEEMFKNEAVMSNTLDPSPYFGMKLNIADWPARPIRCGEGD